MERNNAHTDNERIITMSNHKTIKTSYRRLENLLYSMGIKAISTSTDWDGSTVWEYPDTPEVRLVAASLKDLEAQLKAMREGADHV